MDFWPLYSYRRDLNGNSRLQVLALLESYMPTSEGMNRDYSPLWSLWRSEKNSKTGAASQSLLWNLYRHDSTKGFQRTSALFGLFQTRSDAEGKHMRLCYIPLKK